jgi:hypothetical protein
MANALEITTILKKAIKISEIEQDRLAYFIDKRKDGRRHKFYQIKPTEQQVDYLNKLLETAGINATAKILKAKVTYGNWVSPFSNNCLVIYSK